MTQTACLEEALSNAQARPPSTAEAAPYAVVRLTSLATRPESPAAARYRAAAGRLAELHRWCLEAAEPLVGQLHDEIRDAAPRQRQALLAIRRDVHNQRDPRPAARELVSPAERRLPLLAQWFVAREEIGRLGGDLNALAEAALAADRAGLAAACDAESLRRAVSMTSENLLRAVERAAAQGSVPDDRARKSEATVLRYVLRATTRTTPLSWFTEVRWGQWVQAVAPPGRDLGHVGRLASWPGGGLAVACQADRAALGGLVQAVLREPGLRFSLPHRLAPGLRADGGRASFRRLAPAGRTPDGVTREEEVELPMTGALRLVLHALRDGGSVTPGELAGTIVSRLPGGDTAAVTRYVHALIDEQLLRPTAPVDPQATNEVADTAAWLRRIGLRHVAEILATIDTETSAFAAVPGVARPAALAGLRRHWSDAFTAVGAEPVRRPVPLTEDVVGTEPLALGPEQGARALGSLARLAPLFELFDQYSVVRRAALDRFVERYGRGGSCAALEEFAAGFAAAWRTLDQVGPEGTIHVGDGAPVSAELREIAAARAAIVAAAGTAGGTGEIVLADDVVDACTRLLPRWLHKRPASYAVFASPAPAPGDGTVLCVNQVFGGWGRFTSRFLPALPSVARQQVRHQITTALGQGRVAQIRPVQAFNANLHPRIVDDEVGDDPRWATIMTGHLHLVHDLASDALRVRDGATGDKLNVLYLGFLLEAGLQDRLLPLATDLASGLVGYACLAPAVRRATVVGDVLVHPRLRYRDVVLARRQWQISAETMRLWRADLAAAAAPGGVVARWRAMLGLPEQVYIGAVPGAGLTGLGVLQSYADRPKSQYADLGSALHQRALSRTLARYPGDIKIEEALPAPQPGRRGLEVVAEIYRRCP